MKNEQLKILLDGNDRFINGTSNVNSQLSIKKMQVLAEFGQRPKTIILTCSDSRVPAEILFDQCVGELFVIRVAGNVVAPSLIASIEFAASNFGCSLIIVLGHTKCGAIQATIDYYNKPKELPPSKNLTDLINRILPAVNKAHLETDSDLINLSINYNVKSSIDNILSESSIIQALVDKNEISIVGAILDIHTGKVSLI